MEKKTVKRRCVGCRESFDKRQLIRVIRTPEGKIELDLTGKSNGRGAYLCRNAECLKKARKKRSLNSSLNVSVPDEIYDKLEKELNEIES